MSVIDVSLFHTELLSVVSKSALPRMQSVVGSNPTPLFSLSPDSLLCVCMSTPIEWYPGQETSSECGGDCVTHRESS